MKKWHIVVAAAILAIAPATFKSHAAAKLKIGFVYLGPIGDLGWTYQHDVGRRALVAAFGDKIDTTYLENVPEGADAERPIEQMARTGHQLIFAASRLHGADHQSRGKVSERALRTRHRL